MLRSHVGTLLLLAAIAQPMTAQQLESDSPGAAQDHGSHTAEIHGPPPHLSPVPAFRTAEPASRSALRGAIHYLGGAVIGGWVGFVGAQVSHSDWDRKTTGELREQRATWALAGVAVGLVAARIIPSSSPRTVAAPERGFATPTRDRLAMEEIQASGANNAFDLIRGARPEWLVTRGTNSWRETTQGSGGGMGRGGIVVTHQGDPKILVYLNGLRLGGVDRLTDIDTAALSGVEFLDPHRAVLRFGSSAAHGAILLTTVVDAP